MSNDKAKSVPKGLAALAGALKGPPAAPEAGKVAPLFRSTDWYTFLITFATVWIGYYFTLAPALTLEDSGELATGSLYAGIPHPPGYPVWTIYTWLWTVLLPIKNVAWRVALGEATGGALAAGLLGLIVSRGSSLLMEGIEELKAMAGKWESAICMVAGFAAGGLIGFNGYMWSQSVIVEVYSFSVASLMLVFLFLLRWIYAPHQRRYLYYALFFHGVSFTNHQTLIVAAMGIEVAIAAADFKLGRNLFLANTWVYLAGLILSQEGILTGLTANPAIFTIFNVVGVCSIAAYIWFAVLTQESFPELCRDALWVVFWISLAAIPTLKFFGFLVALAAVGGFIKLALDTRERDAGWVVVLICGVGWVLGASFYLYMALAGMSNPPMQWGYPRTVEGFIHAFTRGQYEKTNPTDIIGDPLRFITQLTMMGQGVLEEFNWVYAFIAVVPFLFFRKLHKRERAWLIGLGAIYLCLGVLLLILLNPPPDRAARELVRVFFTASHTVIALLVGYGITLIAAYMATHYQQFRRWGMMGGGIALALAVLSFTDVAHKKFFGEAAPFKLGEFLALVGSTFTNKDQYGLPVFAGLILVGSALAFLVSLWVYRSRAPLLVSLVIFAAMPLYSFMSNWSDNEQRNHWFGYWFGHDMFTPSINGADGKPIYPEMAKDAVLYGGTDPGRFCPTYMIFCDSFLPEDCQPEFDKKFDRRDVYIITQNALADGTYLNYIRAHYNRSAQIDPPFFQELFRSEKERMDNYTTNRLARLAQPLDHIFGGLGDRIEKQRRTYTSWFEDDHFRDLPGFTSRLAAQSDPLSKFIFENLRPETQKLLSTNDDQKSLRRALAADLNQLLDRELQVKRQIREITARRAMLLEDVDAGSSPRIQAELKALDDELARLAKLPPLYTPERFQHLQLSEYLADFIKQNPQSHTRVRLNRLLLEAAYPKEITATKGGVYPDREIYIASPDDSQRCFSEYLADAQRRLQVNQLKPGEDVKLVDNRVQVSGQVAVMAINGLLTKVMFDHNPKNEFYVEESFPLDWMFPHLTPYGIIMKINRQPVPEFTDDIIRRDHEFWTRFSERLIGNWIGYDTTVKEIADFVEKVYLRRNFVGFKGDRKFVRDDQAQKAFSKLRSSIGGVYNYRIGVAQPGSAEQQRVIREADFAFRQAFAFCPYSPEAVFRYVNLLLTMQRLDDAILVAQTCLKLDPFNGQVIDLVKRLQGFKAQPGAVVPPGQGIAELERSVLESPTNWQLSFNLASAYLQIQQNARAVEVLDRVLNHPQIEPNAVLGVAQMFAQLGSFQKLDAALEKLVTLVPESPEAWFDLAAVKAAIAPPAEVMRPLRKALELDAKRRAADPKARNILTELKNDPRFGPLRATPEFQQLLSGFGP